MIALNQASRKAFSKIFLKAFFKFCAERKVWSSKFYKSAIGSCREGYSEFKVLLCYRVKSGSKTVVWTCSKRNSRSEPAKRCKKDLKLTLTKVKLLFTLQRLRRVFLPSHSCDGRSDSERLEVLSIFKRKYPKVSKSIRF